VFLIDLQRARDRGQLLGIPRGCVRINCFRFGTFTFFPGSALGTRGRLLPGLFVTCSIETFQDLPDVLREVFAWYRLQLEGTSRV
jgi:hypothetical protein